LNVPLLKKVIKQRSTIYHNKIGHVNVLTQWKKTKKELANRPTRRLMTNYFWISLFTLYWIRAN
jgi:hypothetical protein